LQNESSFQSETSINLKTLYLCGFKGGTIFEYREVSETRFNKEDKMLYNIVHRDFFGEVDRLNRFAEQFFGSTPMRSRVYEPVIRMQREDDGLLVEATVPGFSQDQLNLEIKDQVLELSGHQQAVTSEGDQEDSVSEGYEAFKRRIRLPFRVNSKKTQASLENGILQVRLEEPPEDKPLKIEIK